MATTLIQNGAISGAAGAILAGRIVTDDDPADYATLANAADAFSDAFLTANAALVAPMADADNAQIGTLIAQIVFGVMSGRAFVSATAADYAAIAEGAVAACKQAVGKLV